jgi:hypothetical protein
MSAIDEIKPDAWSLVDIPPCREGMRLAAIFMSACRHAVERAGVEQTVSLRRNFYFEYGKFAAHYEGCDRCSGRNSIYGSKQTTLTRKPVPDVSVVRVNEEAGR